MKNNIFSGRFFDAGGVALPLLFAPAIVQVLLILSINSRWPAVSLAERQADAVAQSQKGLAAIDKGNALLQIGGTTVNAWFVPTVNAAVKKFNQDHPDIQLEIFNPHLAFIQQAVEVSGGFKIVLKSHALEVAGDIDGLGFLALDGNRLTVQPAINRLRVRDVKSLDDSHWWLRPIVEVVFSELSAVRDNINGQLSAYRTEIPVAPITLRGQPRKPIDISYPDPFKPGQTINSPYMPPVLKGASLLVDQDVLSVFAEFSLDDIPAPVPDPVSTLSFYQFQDAFTKKIADSGMRVLGGTNFQLAESFIKDLFARYVGPMFTRDRVTQAVNDSIAALPSLQTPDLGIRLDSQFVKQAVFAEVNKQLAQWAKEQKVTISPLDFQIRPQHFYAQLTGEFTLPNPRATIGAAIAVALPAAGGNGAIRVFPSLDSLQVTKVDTTDFGDLTGLLGGINTLLAATVGAANTILAPQNIGMNPVKLDPIDFAMMAAGKPGLTVSPASYTPPALAFKHIAFLIDTDRIMLMSDINSAAAPAPVPLPQGDFPFFKARFLEKWNSTFEPDSRAGVAKAQLRTSAIASYLNNSVNAARTAVSYTTTNNDHGESELVISEVPKINCKPVLNCPGCEWWNLPCQGIRAACEVANGALMTGCAAANGIVVNAINGILNTLGRNLGTLKTDAHVEASARAENLRLNISDAFDRVNVSVDAGGRAAVHADIHFESKGVGGHLVCPFDFRTHVPVPTGDIHGTIPMQTVTLDSTVGYTLESTDGKDWRVDFLLTPQNAIPIHGSLDTPPYLQLRLVMLSMQVQCPITNLLNFIPGLPEILGLFDITSIGAVVTDGNFTGIINAFGEPGREIFLGQFNREIPKPGPVSFGFRVPVIKVAGQTIHVKPALAAGWLTTEASP